jgi:peptidoglycan hydrolase CwlO-like protein
LWAFKQLYGEVKRIQILLNQTRETYARRDDVREDMGQVMQHLNRIEDKLDNLLIK